MGNWYYKMISCDCEFKKLYCRDRYTVIYTAPIEENLDQPILTPSSNHSLGGDAIPALDAIVYVCA